MATTVAVARQSLQDARDDLDHAVGRLPDVQGDNAMATPALLALLFRVVTARRQLTGLEIGLSSENDNGSLRMFPRI